MSRLTDNVDELFAKWNRPDSPGCSLAIIKDGEIIYERGYGMADLERNIALKADSVFDIGSVGKQFTAMLIAMLARRGALNLGDSIRKHIPEIPEYAQAITIRHLVHHISGLRDYTALLYFSGRRIENFYYEEELLDLICRQKELNFRPGDEFEYSNTNYVLLGVIAKRVTGKSLPAMFQEYILNPLSMRSTSFNDDAGRIVKNRAIGYSPQEDGFRNDMSFNGGFGDGMILTTVEDLFLWDQNFYHNKLGNGGNELVQEIITPGALNTGEGLDYAFGLRIDKYKGLRRIGHAGEWAGYRSDYLRFPEQKFSVICLANLSSIEPRRLTEQVANLYLGNMFTEGEQLADQKETQKADNFIELTTSQIEYMSGVYYDQKKGEYLKLIVKEDKFTGEGFGLSFPIVATGPMNLLALQTPSEIEIGLDKPKPGTPLTISVKFGGGKPIQFEKMAITSISPAQYGEYVGIYHSEELNAIYQILLDGERLCFRRGYSAPETLEPVTLDFFRAGEFHFVFESDEHKRVCGFQLRAGMMKAIRFTQRM
jgi:CubicO group peptidase (beta-lactamase class C family)